MAFEFAKSAFFILCGTICILLTTIVIFAVTGTLLQKAHMVSIQRKRDANAVQEGLKNENII